MFRSRHKYYYALINQLGPYGRYSDEVLTYGLNKMTYVQKLTSGYFPYEINNYLIRALLYSCNEIVKKFSETIQSLTKKKRFHKNFTKAKMLKFRSWEKYSIS